MAPAPVALWKLFQTRSAIREWPCRLLRPPLYAMLLYARFQSVSSLPSLLPRSPGQCTAEGCAALHEPLWKKSVLTEGLYRSGVALHATSFSRHLQFTPKLKKFLLPPEASCLYPDHSLVAITHWLPSLTAHHPHPTPHYLHEPYALNNMFCIYC